MVGVNRNGYEKLIADSQLFSLDKEKQHSLYRREALKMVEYLYCYLMETNSQKYEQYGVEIVDTAKRCIENYDVNSGRFLNYFNAAWKKTYGHIVGKSIIQDNFAGIHFTEDEQRNYRRYMKLAQSIGIDTASREFDLKVAEAMGLPISEIEILRKMANSRSVSTISFDQDGEEFNLIDQIDSGIYTETGLIQTEAAIELLELIETVFDQLQDRQKPLLAGLITSKLALLVADSEKINRALMGKTYFEESIYIECIRRGESIQAKEIAEKHGIKEASVSRTWKVFKGKLRQKKEEGAENGFR